MNTYPKNKQNLDFLDTFMVQNVFHTNVGNKMIKLGIYSCFREPIWLKTLSNYLEGVTSICFKDSSCNVANTLFLSTGTKNVSAF